MPNDLSRSKVRLFKASYTAIIQVHASAPGNVAPMSARGANVRGVTHAFISVREMYAPPMMCIHVKTKEA